MGSHVEALVGGRRVVVEVDHALFDMVAQAIDQFDFELANSFSRDAEFFADERAVGPKVAILDDLGLGYLTLGQSSTTLSGGEVLVTGTPAQVAKCRSSHTGRFLKDYV